MTVAPNPEEYENLRRPFPSPAVADVSLRAFFDAVEAARLEHGISDVFVCVQISIAQPHGAPRYGSASAYFGDPASHKLALLARAYGQARAEHETMLGDLIEAGRVAHAERAR